MTDKTVDATQFLSVDERALLTGLGVSISSTGLTFARALGEGDLRAIWGAVAAVRRRSANADWTNWLVGDWGNEAIQRLGEGSEGRIIHEEETEFYYAQHLFGLAGATLYSLQLTERSIEVCCRLLAPEQIPGAVFEVDAAVRRKTLGQLSQLLKERRLFIDAFEQKMDQFVDHRNRFTHRLWVEVNRHEHQGHRGRMAMLKGRERFMRDLLAESHAIGKIFKGLFVAIGVSLAE